MKMRFYFLIIVSFLSKAAISQLDDGSYKYGNAEITLSFSIINGGWDMKNIVIKNNSTGSTISAVGEWFKVNMNGVEPGYTGPEGWYQFQSKDCNYEFDVPGTKLVLNQFDCKNSGKNKEYILSKKK